MISRYVRAAHFDWVDEPVYEFLFERVLREHLDEPDRPIDVVTSGRVITGTLVHIQDAIVTMKQRDGSTVDFNGNDIIHILRTIYSST